MHFHRDVKIGDLRAACILFLTFLSFTNSTAQNMEHDKPVKAFSEVNGLKMYYEIHGKGKPLVLIHGGGSTIHTSFGRIIDQLSANHKVIAVELQAHGHTGDRGKPLTFEQDAGDKDVATLEHTLEMHRLIEGSELMIIPGGHGDYIGEITTLKAGSEPYRQVTELIERFLLQ